MERILMDWLLYTVINNCWWIKLQWIVLYIASLVYDNEFHVVRDFYTSVRYTSYCACRWYVDEESYYRIAQNFDGGNFDGGNCDRY